MLVLSREWGKLGEWDYYYMLLWIIPHSLLSTIKAAWCLGNTMELTVKTLAELRSSELNGDLENTKNPHRWWFGLEKSSCRKWLNHIIYTYIYIHIYVHIYIYDIQRQYTYICMYTVLYVYTCIYIYTWLMDVNMFVYYVGIYIINVYNVPIPSPPPAASISGAIGWRLA